MSFLKQRSARTMTVALLAAFTAAATLAGALPLSASAYDINGGDVRAASASAAPHQPDGWIRKAHRLWVGNDVYNSDGTNQHRTASTVPGSMVKFRIALQNDGREAVALRAVAFGSTAIGYDVRYFQGTTDITAAIDQGSFQTRPIQPGDWVFFRAEVTVTASAATDSSVSRRIVIVPIGPHSDSELDAVKFVVKRALDIGDR